ncbi:hypothetical protein D3C77_407560 [compost metagenome]
MLCLGIGIYYQHPMASIQQQLIDRVRQLLHGPLDAEQRNTKGAGQDHGMRCLSPLAHDDALQAGPLQCQELARGDHPLADDDSVFDERHRGIQWLSGQMGRKT